MFSFFSSFILLARLQTDVRNRYATVTVDGTNVLVNEVHPLNSNMCLHKSKLAAMQWEVAILINGSNIVHINQNLNAIIDTVNGDICTATVIHNTNP